MGISYASVLGFQKLYTTEINLMTVGAYFFIVYALVITLTRPSMGRLMDAKGDKWVLYPSYLFLTLGLALLGSAMGSVTYLLSGALIGLVMVPLCLVVKQHQSKVLRNIVSIQPCQLT